MAEQFGHLALETLYDSLKVFGFAFAIYVILSFFEGKIASLMGGKKKLAPAIGASVGLIPQCGLSVVATSLFNEGSLTIGTLIAIYFACSDEALPIFFKDFTNNRWYMVFLLLAIKLVFASIIGIVVDLIFSKQEIKDPIQDEIHVGCCHHDIEEHEEESKLVHHFLHPLWHSFKLFLYCYVISFAFGSLLIGVGEDNVISFLSASKYLSPLFAALIGMVPNCASSVLITDLYLMNGIPFGALVAGLCCNAGLGPIYLFKNTKNWKKSLQIVGILVLSSLVVGYAFIWIG